jgi:uncharacterized membrane protein
VTIRTACYGAILAALALATLPGIVHAQTFHRTVTYCNRTADPLVVAVGFDRAGTTQITSKGWTGIAACSCRAILDEELRATEVFIMAAKKGTSTPLVQGTGPMCIHPTNGFEFRRENANQATCQQAGGQWVKFTFHDTGTRKTLTVTHRRQGHQPCNL